MNSDNLESMDRAREPDSCHNCARSGMCGIASARCEFNNSKAVKDTWMLATNLKLHELLPQHCGHYLREEE